MRRQVTGCLPAITLVSLLLFGCAAPTEDRPQTSPREVQVVMSEYEFEAPQNLAYGPITFRVRNQGREEHDLTLIRIPDTLKKSLDDQLRSDRRVPVVPIAALKRRSPGQSGFFAVNLEPGRYGMVCFTRGSDGVAHATKGMSREFRISNS